MAMEIHRLKHPIHGLREFLKEVGIIVLGVLIALGAEQAVEALHWRHETEATEETLRDEIRSSLNFASERIIMFSCDAQRVRELYEQLRGSTRRWQAPAAWAGSPFIASFPQVLGTPHRPWATGIWDVAVADGALAHLPRSEVEAYSGIYREVEQLRALEEDVDRIVRALEPLAYDQSLDDAHRFALEGELAQLDVDERRMALVSGQLIEVARHNGITPERDALASAYAVAHSRHGACVISPASVMPFAARSFSGSVALRALDSL